MQNISVESLKSKLDSKGNVNILDVREADEHTKFNIGGVLLPIGEIMNFQTDPIDHLKDEELIVHCRTGKRSLQACVFLEQAGFTKILNLEGGIVAWQEMLD